MVCFVQLDVSYFKVAFYINKFRQTFSLSSFKKGPKMFGKVIKKLSLSVVSFGFLLGGPKLVARRNRPWGAPSWTVIRRPRLVTQCPLPRDAVMHGTLSLMALLNLSHESHDLSRFVKRGSTRWAPSLPNFSYKWPNINGYSP